MSETKGLMTFSNPRKLAQFDDWPIGGSNRGKCEFEIETTKRGMRARRRTTDKYGRWCKWKEDTYGDAVCLVDGSDGRIYVLSLHNLSQSITIRRHDFMSAERSYVTASDSDYASLVGLILSAR